MSDETTAEMLAEIDRDLADIEKAVSALQQQAAEANYPQQVETTTEMLAEIEGQAADYTPPEGWRVLAVGEKLQLGDMTVRSDGYCYSTERVGYYVGLNQRYIRRSEPEPEQTITPDDVAAEALQQQLETTEAALLEQQQQNEQLVTQGSQQRMEIAELQAQVAFLKNRELTLGTRLEEEKAVSTKRLQQVEELRSEVSQVHRQWGDARWRVEELEQKLAEPQPQPVHLQAMVDSQAETIARLNSEMHELNIDIVELETQLEAVKAELVQVSKDRQALQIELDAYELRSHNVSDRFEEGWDAGTARAVETIAEWTEPFRTCGSQSLALAVLQNLPHIMRTLTGLTDED